MNAADFGITLACLNARVSPSQLPELQGFSGGMRKAAGAETFGRQIADMAHEIFVQAGEGASFEAGLYGHLAKTANWQDVHFDLLSPVYLALEQVLPALEKKAMHKSAEDGAISSGLKWLGALGLGAGTTLGTLHWALNRDATQDDAQSKSLSARTDLYRQLAKEISSELKTNPPKDMRAALRRKTQEVEPNVV